MIVLLLVGALIVGVMIGTVGIGGVLLAPMLILLMGYDVQLAIATSLWSFLFTGLMGAYSYHKKGSIDWKKTGWLVLGIIPASFLGAQTNVSLPPQVVTGILAVVILYSAINVLWKRQAPDGNRTSIPGLWLVLIGVVVGFGSALTGTGGAVMLMPIFLLMKVPALMAIGVVQGIQLPIAFFSSLGYILFGEVDFVLGTVLGLVQAVGVYFGAQFAHRLPTARLRQYAAYALILSVLMLLRQFFV